MKHTFIKIFETFSTFLVVIVVLLALLLAGPRIIGMQVFSVLSGSMEPTYHTGSLIYVKDVNPYKIEAGDVITFMIDEDTVATHRVVEVVPDEEDSSTVRFRTKGDANNVEDGSLVHYKNVLGSPVFTIPKMGYFANFIQNPPGMYLAISAGAIIMMFVFLPDLFSSEEQSGSKRRKRKSVEDSEELMDKHTK